MAKNRLEYSSVELDKDNLPKTKDIPIQRIGGPAAQNGFSRSSLMESRVGLDKVSKYTYNMPYEADPIEWKAQHQTAGNQLVHGAGRFLGTTATKFLEGIGYLGALPEAIVKGDLTAAMDNSFSAVFSALEEDIKEALPIHHSRKYLEGNILQQMGTLGFYMDDVVDGAAFMAQAVLGAKGIGAISKGLGVYGRLGKAYSRFTKAAKTGRATEMAKRLPNVSAVMQEMDLTTMTLFNSYIEAMFEGKDILDQMLEQGSTREEAARAAVSTFKWNIAALMPSNHLTNSLIFKQAKPGIARLARIKDPKTGKLLEEVLPLTRGQKLGMFGKGALASVLAEGPYEENIQHSVQNYFDENNSKAFSSEAIGGVLGGMINNFFTDEGQKAIVLGSIIGLIPGGVGGVRQAIAENKNEKLAHTLMGQTFAGIENDPTLKELYLKDEEGNIVKDEAGTPMKDPMKVAIYFARQFNTDLNLVGTLISSITGNKLMEERFREQRIASLAYSMLFHPDALTHMATELESLARLELESETSKGEEIDEQELKERVEEYKKKALQYKTIYDNVTNVFGGIWNFEGDTKNAFKDMVMFEQFHGAVDQMYWINERNKLEAERERLQSSQSVDPVTGEPLFIDPDTGEPTPSVQEAINTINQTLPAIEEMIETSQSLYKSLLNESKQKERFEAWKEEQRKAEQAAEKKKKKDAEEAARKEAGETVEEDPVDKEVKDEISEERTIQEEVSEEVKAEEERIKSTMPREQRLKARKESAKRTLEEPVDTELTGAETIGEVKRKILNKKYGERYGHPTLINQNLKSAFEAVGEANVPVIYQGQVGEMFIDKETNEVIVREVESGKEHIITKTTNAEMYEGNYSSSQLGITPLKHTVFDFEFSQDGTSMFIQGKEYKVPIGKNLDSFIEHEDDGSPTAVTLEDYNGNTLRFTNPALVEEIAYAFALVEEARHVASEKFLKDAESDFTVVRDPSFPTAEYYVYNVNGEWVVTRPRKQEVEVRGTKALDLGLTTLPEGRVKDRILKAFFSDLTDIAERYYSDVIYETVREEEEMRKTIDKEIKNEIRQIVKHSRPATPKETLDAPSAGEVQAPKKDTKKQDKKRSSELKVSKTEAVKAYEDKVEKKDKSKFGLNGSYVSTKPEMEFASFGRAIDLVQLTTVEELNLWRKWKKLRVQADEAVTNSPEHAALRQEARKTLQELSNIVAKRRLSELKKAEPAEETKKVDESTEKAKKVEEDLIDKKAEEKAESQETKEETVPEDTERATEEGVEPLNEDESLVPTKKEGEETEEDLVERRGLRHTFSAAAVPEEYYKGTAYKELNKLLSKVASNDLSGYTLSAEIDYDYEPAEYDNFSWDKHKRTPGYILTMVDKILKDNKGEDPFISFIDRIPIKLTLYDKEGKQVDIGGPLYLHQSGYDNIHVPENVEDKEAHERKEMLATRRVRQQVVRSLVADQEVIFTNLDKGKGILNVSKDSVPLHEVFEEGEIKDSKIGIARGEGTIFAGDNSIMPGSASVGNVFFGVHTADGEAFSLKLNVSRIRETEAKILLNAYRIAATSPAGFQTLYPTEDDIRASVSGDLTVGEVISLLVLDGQITNQDNRDKNPIVQPYLIPKQLYFNFDTGFLHFGENKINIKKKIVPEEANLFIKHTTENKNYIVDSQKLGKKLEKSFRIGEITGKKGQSYEEFLIYNDLLLTNAAKDPETGTIFSKPVLTYDTEAYTDFIPSEGERTEAIEKVAENRSKEPEKSSKESSESNQEVKPKKTTVEFKSVEDLYASPDGTVIYSDPGIFKEQIGILVTKGGYKTFIATATDPSYKNRVSQYDNMKVSDPSFANLFSKALTGERIVLERPNIEEAAKVKFGEEKAPEKAPEKVKPKRSRDDIASIGDEDAKFPRKRQNAPEEYKVGDMEQATAWLKNKFGDKLTVKQTRDLISVAVKSGSVEAFGLFTKDGITLSEKMEQGTEFHEAFHRVSLLLLSPEQREQLYKDAEKKYPGITDRTELEEALAEDFRNYMLETREAEHIGKKGYSSETPSDIYKVRVRGNEAIFSVPENSPAEVVEAERKKAIRSLKPSVKDRISNFFRDLWDFLVTAFTGKLKVSDLTVDNLFRVIKKSGGVTGRLTHSRINKKSSEWLGNRYYLKHVAKGRQFEHIQDPDTFNNIVDNLMYTMVRNSDISSFKDIEKLDYATPFSAMAKRADKAYEYSADSLQEGNVEEANGWRKLGDMYQEVFDNRDLFMEAMDDYLLRLGITTILPEDPEDSSDIRGDNIERYGKASFEQSVKDNAASEIKFLIATLKSSKELDDTTSLYKFVDFDEMWNDLLEELHSFRTVKEMEQVIAERANEKSDNYPYLDLLDKLNRSRTLNRFDSLRTKFFVTMRKNRYNMSNGSFNRKGNRYELEVGNAETQSTAATYASSWGQNFLSSDIFKDGTLDETKMKAVLGKYSRLSKAISGYYNDSTKTLKRYKEVFDSVIELFNSVSIPVNEDVLESWINSILRDHPYANKEEALFRLVVDPMHKVTTFFSSKKGPFAALLTTGTIKNGAGREIPLQEIFRNERLVRNTIGNHYSQVNNDERVTMIMGPDGNPYYLYSENSFMTDLVNDLIQDDELYSVLTSIKYNKNSNWLKQIEDPNVRNKVKIFVQSAFSQQDTGDRGRHIQNLSKIEERLLKITLLESGYIPLPTLADRKNLYSISGINPFNFKYLFNSSSNEVLYPSEAIDIMEGYMKDEINRIERTKNEIDEAKRNKTEYLLFNNYHFKLDENGNRNYKEGNGIKFHHFTEFNDKLDKINKGQIDGVDLRKEAIRILGDRINDTLLDFESLGIIKGDINNKNKLVKIKNNLLDYKKVAKEAKDRFNGNESLAVKNIVANYTLNSIMSTIESEKIFFGDPAFYKNLDDKIKRYTAIASTGNNLRIGFPPSVLPGERIIHSSSYNSSVIRTQKFNSKELHAELRKRFIDQYTSQGMTKGEAVKRAEKKLKAYTDVDQSDAQAYITPEMHRSLKIRTGEWSELDQEAYELVIANKDKYTPEEQSKMDNLMMQPLKYVHFGHVYDFPGLAAPTFYKMSLATITPQMVEGTQLEELYDRMHDETDPIDMALFDSAVKAGIRSVSGFLGEDMEGNRLDDVVDVSEVEGLRTFKIPFKDLRKSVETDPKNELVSFVGTQLRKIVMSNIMDNVVYDIGGDKIKGSELKKEYKELINNISDEGRTDLFNILGVDHNTLETIDKQKELDFVIDRARKANMPDSFIEALTSQVDGVPMEYDALPDRKWIQTTFISQMNKRTVDLHLPGTAMIQMSNFGLRKMTSDNSLKTMDSEGYMEAKVSIEVFREEIPNYDSLTYKERVEIAKKMFKGIGYRIPTQGLNSVVPLKIVDFLPPHNTDTIVLPAEFTALTGSDFDIDKLYFLRYNYEETKDGLKPIQFLTSENSTIKERMIAKAPEFLNEEINKISDEYAKSLEEKFEKRDDLWQDIQLAKEEIKGISALSEMFQDDYDTQEDFIAAKAHLNTKYKIAKEVAEETRKLIEERNKEKTELIDLWVETSQKEFEGWDIYKQNTSKAKDNKLIDVFSAVLLSNNHFVDNMTPLDAPTSDVKNIADRISELEQTEREFPSLYSASPTYQSMVKDKYGGGKTGIGPFANSNVHHVFGQIAGLYLRGNIGYGNTTTIDDVEYTDLSAIKGLDGENILDWLSALINAHVDIAKDPYIFTLNVNEQTYDSAALLIRAGVGNLTFPYLAQPVLKEQAEAYSLNRGKIKAGKKNVRKKYVNLYNKALKAEKKAKRDYAPGDIFDEKRLYKDIDINTPRNSEFYARQLQVLDHYRDLSEKAYFLREAVSASRIDTKQYGTSLMEIKSFNNLVLKVFDDDVIGNIDKMFSETYLQKLYDNSVKLAPTLFKDKSVTSSRAISELHQSILDEIGKRYDISRDSKYYIKLIEDELYAGIASRFFREMMDVTSGTLEEMQIGENSIPARIIRTFKNNPEYSSNRFVKMLNPILSFKGKEPDVLGIFNPTDNKSKWSKDRTIEAWEQLINDPNKEVSDLAKDLVIYSFYTSGFTRRLHSFFSYIPPAYLKEIGFSDYFKEMKVKFNETGIDNVGLTLREDVYKNLWFNDDVVPFVSYGFATNKVEFKDAKKQKIDYPAFIKVDSNYPLDKGKLIVGKNSVGDFLFRPYIKTIISNNEYLYRYVGYDYNEASGKIDGVYTVENKLGYAKSGKVLKEHGFNTSILPQNNVKTIDSEDHIKRLDTFENYSGFMYVSPEERFIEDYLRKGVEDETEVEDLEEPQVYYEGDIEPSPNTIFVFGSNPQGRHGAGAARVARERFGAKYGQGEGLQGNSYALPTKDIRVKENRGFKSISESEIIDNIKRLYETARENPQKQFKVAYRNTNEISLNGYTGLEMIDMFNQADNIPSNVIFSKEWLDTGLLNVKTPSPETTTESSMTTEVPTKVMNELYDKYAKCKRQ